MEVRIPNSSNSEPQDPAAPQIWKDDHLSREVDARFLIGFLKNKVVRKKEIGQTGSFVLNIDARWGEGKTFFLERMRRQLESEKQLVCSINAWRDDHTSDPLVALMAEVDRALQPYLRKSSKAETAWRTAKEQGAAIIVRGFMAAGKTMAEKYIGTPLGDLVDNEESGFDEVLASGLDAAGASVEAILDKEAERLISVFETQKKSIETFGQKVSQAIAALEMEGQTLLFVLIDELDRCRPTYAISLLERIKHVFEVENVVFVIATDNTQLQHSVRGAYGGEFDGFRYLQRFFEATFSFSVPSIAQFVSYHRNKIDEKKIIHPDDSLENFLISVFEAWKPDLRTFLQWIELSGNVITAWNRPNPVELTLLLPLVINYHSGRGASWELRGATQQWLSRRIVHNNLEYSGRTRMGGQPVDFNALHASVLQAFNDAGSARTSLPGDDFTRRYIDSCLEREFPGGAVPRPGTKSNQLAIQAMVSACGRLNF